MILLSCSIDGTVLMVAFDNKEELCKSSGRNGTLPPSLPTSLSIPLSPPSFPLSLSLRRRRSDGA